MQNDWSLTIIGHIVQIDKEDVDKTGQHKKFFYEYLVRPESVEGWLPATHPPAEFVIRVKDMDLRRLTTEILLVGDHVALTANANGLNPTMFYLTSVKKLATP